ncbi:hypothetical protein ACFLXV_00715 [Chloroflexota bacterium]
MKSYRLLAILLLVSLLTLLMGGVASAQTLPVVTTDAASDVTTNSATLNGNLTDMGNASSVDVSFEWGLTVSYGNETGAQSLTETGTFNDSIGGLDPGVTYHYRAKAVGNSTAYGSDVPFTTGTSSPTVSTGAATNVTSESAVLNGVLTDLGTAGSVDVSFEWGLTTGYGNETTAQALGSTGAFNDSISSLSPNTTYHFRAKAVGDGTAYGDDLSLTTIGRIELEGIGFCTSWGAVIDVSFSGYVTITDRTHASPGSSLHVVGNITLHRPDGSDEIIDIEMYGNRVRSLFYLKQETTGKSITLSGSWIDTESGEPYIYASGGFALPNPEGESLKTARVGFVILRTPDVNVPDPERDGFVADMESIVARFTRLIDGLWDSLIGTGFRELLSGIISQLSIMIVALRDALGGSYVP